MGNIQCCQKQDLKKNNSSEIQIDRTVKNASDVMSYSKKLKDQIQFHQNQSKKSNHKTLEFTDFDKTQEIPQYIAVKVQNLTELHAFFKNIVAQYTDSLEKKRNTKQPQQKQLQNIDNYEGFYIPQSQKQCLNIIQQVKQGIFQVKKKTKKNMKALQIDDSVKLNSKVSNQKYTKSQWNTQQNKQLYAQIRTYGYQQQQQVKPKTPKNKYSQNNNEYGYKSQEESKINTPKSISARNKSTFFKQLTNVPQIPKNIQQTPYFIPWLSKLNNIAVYIGQWRFQNKQLKKNLPFGIGRLYVGGKWILEGFIQTVINQQSQINQSNSQYKEQNHVFLKQMKKILDNKDKLISKKIQSLSLNLSIVLNGHGRKFNQFQQYLGQFVKGKLHCNNGIYRNLQLQYEYQGKFIYGKKTGKGTQKTKLTYYQGSFLDDKKEGYGTLIFYISTKKQRQRQAEQQKLAAKNPQTDLDYKQIKSRVQMQLDLQKASNKILKIYLKEKIKNYQGDYLFTLESSMNISLKQNLRLEQNLKTVFLQKYIGQFKNDKFHGKGSYQWSNGNYYVGDWQQGKMNGKGQFYWKQGFSYIGQYKNDLKHGSGQMIWDPYRRYRGSWAFGKKHGYGQQIRIELNQNEDLIILIKACLWNGNQKTKQYWVKKIPVQNQSLNARILLLKNIQFYCKQLPLLSQQKKIQLQSLEYYEKPCTVCDEYFLKVNSKKKRKGNEQKKNQVQNYTPQILKNFVSKINQEQKKEDKGISIFGKLIKQPQICPQCSQKLKLAETSNINGK